MYTRFIYVYSSLYSKAALLNYELEVDITGCPLVTVAQSDTLEHFAQRYPLYIWRTRESNEWIKVPHWCVFCCCPSSFLSCFSISLYRHACMNLHSWMTIAHEISVPCFFFFTQLYSGHVAQMCFSLFGAVKINAAYVTHTLLASVWLRHGNTGKCFRHVQSS